MKKRYNKAFLLRGMGTLMILLCVVILTVNSSLARSLQIIVPEEVLEIFKLSIYAGQKGSVNTSQKVFPTIYSASWLSEDSSLGVSLASISDKSYSVNMTFSSKDYGLADSGEIYIVDVEGKSHVGSYSEGWLR